MVYPVANTRVSRVTMANSFNGSLSGYSYSDFLLGSPVGYRVDPLTNER